MQILAEAIGKRDSISKEKGGGTSGEVRYRTIKSRQDGRKKAERGESQNAERSTEWTQLAEVWMEKYSKVE